MQYSILDIFFLYDTQEELLLFKTQLSAVYLVWRYFSCVCFTREHHEWLVSNSSWDGETGHPGHKGNAHTQNTPSPCQVLSTDVHVMDDIYFLSFVVNQNSAETSRRPLWDPQHEAESRHAGDPQGSVWVWRTIRRSPAACEWSREEPAANPESRRGSCSHRRLCASQ